jgi:hypothetical protein
MNSRAVPDDPGHRTPTARSRRSGRWLALLVSLLAAAPAAAQDTVTLYVPALQSERPGLGFAVSAVVGLQVWQTLRKAPTPNPGGLSFGDGVVIWDPVTAGIDSHESAEAVARKANIGAQLVLWGKAYEFGDGVVVQLNLTLPRYHDFRERTPEIWRFAWREGDGTLEADLPSRRYSFEPIVLERAVVERYSRPDAIALYSQAEGGTEVGRLGGRFLALRSGRDAVFVRPAQGREGWVQLPELAANRSEVVDFVSAMVRIYRADWDGARELLARVVESAAAPTALRLDAALLSTRAGLLAGMPPSAMVVEMERAVSVSPHARRGVLYEAMARITAEKAQYRCPRAERLRGLGLWLDGRSGVFAADDSWVEHWRQALSAGRDACP